MLVRTNREGKVRGGMRWDVQIDDLAFLVLHFWFVEGCIRR
jgi:hypothetical protein